MKTFFLAVLLLATARAEPAFVGVLGLQSRELFALKACDGDVAQWRRIGEAFDGYTLVEYQPASDRLIVRHQAETLSLPLRQSAVEPLQLSAGEILAIAAREVERNENWTAGVRFQGPHLFKGNWIVVARQGDDDKAETRVIVTTPAGIVQSYRSPPR